MKINIFFVSLIVITLSYCGSLRAQERLKELQPFDFDVATFPGESTQQTQTNVYVWIRNNHLQFIKSDTVYTARYQINVEIYRDQEVSLLTRDTTTTLIENRYSRNIDPAIQQGYHFIFNLPPKDYLFKIRLLDLNSNGSRVQDLRKKVDLYDTAKLGLSDFLIVSKSNSDTLTEKSVIPPSRIPIQDNIYLYAEILSPENASELGIDISLSKGATAKGSLLSQKIMRKAGITPVVVHLPKAGISWVETKLKLQVKSGSQSAEKTKLLKAFWDQRDPSEGTTENELFNEFYRRVDFANQNFSRSKTPGWKTDHGHVYIIYGAPDNIERGNPSTFSQSSYEIWYYNDLQKKFVFLDEYGFGDYRLVSGMI